MKTLQRPKLTVPKYARIGIAVVGAVFAALAGAPASATPFSFNVTVNDNGTCPGGWTKTPSNDGTSVSIACTTTLDPPIPTGAPVCTGITSSMQSPLASGSTPQLALNGCTAATAGAITYSWNVGGLNGPQVSAPSSSSSWTVSPAITSNVTYYATAKVAAGTPAALSTTYSITLSVATPPPVGGMCAGYTAVDLGEIAFGGFTRDSTNVKGSAVAFGRITIPNPLPTGWAGRTTSFSTFEHGVGTAWKRVYLTKDRPCNFTVSGVNTSQGLTASVYMYFSNAGSTSANAVTVQAGETWYVTVRNILPSGSNSCAAGSPCDFGFLLPFPGF